MAILLPSVLNDALRLLNDAAVRQAFEVLKKNFNAAIQARITGTKEIALQGEFIELFFDDVLEYVRFPRDGWHIQREFTSETSNERADAAIARNSDMHHVIGVVELKGTDTHDLKSVEKQVFTYFHQHPNCHYAIASNYQSVRLYIDNNQGYEEFNIFDIVNHNDYERFRYLYCYLHRDAILGTRTKELREKTVIKEQKITNELYELYKKLRIQLHTDLKAYNRTVNPYLLYQKTQKLLDRFLFILFAEDKDLLPRFTVKTHINRWVQDGRKGTLIEVFFKPCFTT